MGGHGPLRILFVGIAEFDDGIADGNFGVHDRAVGSGDTDPLGTVEGGDEEVNELWSVVYEEVWSDVGEVSTPEWSGLRRCRNCCFFHCGSPLQFGF